MRTAYPTARTVTCDVLAVGGKAQSCYLSGSRLVPALAPVPMTKGPSQKPLGAFFSPSDMRIYTFSRNLIYSNDFNSYYAVCILNGTPFAYSTGDSKNYGFISKTQVIRSAGSSGFTVKTYTGGVRDGVYKNGRIFGVDINDEYKIKWSAVDNPENWEDGTGYIRINTDLGEIYRLVVFGEKIAIVRKYGFTMMSAYGSPENFKLSYDSRKVPQVSPNSVCAVDGKLYFTTSQGAYVYDGTQTKRLVNRYLDEVKTVYSGVVLGEEYFLLGLDSSLNYMIAVYNTKTGESYYIPSQFDALVAGGFVYCLAQNAACVLKPGKEYKFESDEITFGTTGYKTLKELEISAESKVDVEIKCDGKSRIYTGVNGKIRPKMRGKSFKVTISGFKQVYSVTANAEVLNAV